MQTIFDVKIPTLSKPH